MKPPKLKNVIQEVKKCVRNGNVRYTGHALKRMRERGILTTDVMQTLKQGRHTLKKDTYDQAHKDWNYYIHIYLQDEDNEGERRSIGIVVTLNSEMMAVITAIDLEGKHP